MKKVLCIVLSMLICLSFMTVVSADSNAFFYVATNGNDAASGAEATPFATLNKAVEAAKKVGGATIIVKSGEYKLGDTIELGANDGNIAIYGDGDVTFTGGTKIPYSSLTKVTDKAILGRVIEANGKKNLMSVDLNALGVTDFIGMRPMGFIPDASGGYSGDGTWFDLNHTFMTDGTPRGFASTLTYNDEYLTVAEYPNKDFVYTSNVVKSRDGDDFSIKFTVRDERWRKWTEAKDIYGYGYYAYDWCYILAPVDSIDEKGVVSTYIGYGNITTDRRVRFKNLLEEIDLPGEYYLDTDSGILYLIPPKNFKAGEYLTYSAYSKDVFKLNGTKNFKIQGIRFEGTTENFIEATNTDGLYINDCEFTAIGDVVVKLDKCINTTVENSYFHDIGSKGVLISRCGDRQNLISANTKIINCHFERFSQYRLNYAPAIYTRRDVGTLISHCKFNTAPHSAIIFDSNDMTIEYSDFSDLCRETADAGAVYTGCCYNTWGNEIKYNYFHDMQMIDGITTGMQMMAVYLDDCHAQTNVFGNVFYKVDSIALLGGGRSNTFENNIMLDSKKPLVIDNRGMTWSNASAEGGMIPAFQKANDVDWHTDVWAEKYPELMNLEKDEPGIPKYNVLKNNVRFNTPDFNINEYAVQYGTVENNIDINDRKAFVKYGSDFTLAEDSVIFEKLPDFKQIPFNEIGLYEYDAPEVPKPGANSVVPAPEAAPAPDTIKVLLNDEPIDFADVEPQIINSRTMVPLRAIFEALGATVEWDDKTKTVTAVRGDVTIKMTIGKDSFTRNDETVSLDSPATIVDSRTLVPVRAIAESFGATVGWIAESKTVTIKAEDPVVEEPAEDAEATEDTEETEAEAEEAVETEEKAE